MPIKQIPVNIDEKFLSRLANKPDETFGKHNDPTFGLVLSYRSEDTDAFEVALGLYPEAMLQAAKLKRLDELAAERRKHELNGPQGLVLDDKTIMRLTAIALDLHVYTEKESVEWEVTRGVFQTFPRAAILAIAAAAVNHVQNCFLTVKTKTGVIMAIELNEEATSPIVALSEALAALDAVDLTTDWPTIAAG